MTKALIFDLDNCLAPANEVGEELFEPAFDAIRRANHGTVSNEALELAFADAWRHPLDWVAVKYSFSEAMLAAGWRVFVALEVARPMHGSLPSWCGSRLTSSSQQTTQRWQQRKRQRRRSPLSW